jgi:hypothetical protein
MSLATLSLTEGNPAAGEALLARGLELPRG